MTRFFRDHEAFQRLETEILPSALAAIPPDEEFRAWVAGCATGEEAYSLAILLMERLEAMHRRVKVKIFATDVHRASLEFASTGLYSQMALAEVSPERIARHFVRKGDGYQVSQDLRQMVVFAPHNIIKDAPFTKLDLISCRNLVIYFQPPAQKKAMSLFHFGLKTGGILFSGRARAPASSSDEFDHLDAHWKIYRKRRDMRFPADLRLPLSIADSQLRPTGIPPLPHLSQVDMHLVGVYDAILEEHMPPSLLVDENRALVQSFGGASRYLRLRDGRLSTDLLEMVDTDLRMALAGALQRACKGAAPVVYKGLRVQFAEGQRLVNLTVKPIRNRRSSRLYALVSIEELNEAVRPDATEIDFRQASDEQLQGLEIELRYTKENLQATIEELETSNEELQATNEELVASNEELQSTNEELHSVNEELYTVNAEYQKKIAELTELNADMDSLLASTEVHTVFLDRELDDPQVHAEDRRRVQPAAAGRGTADRQFHAPHRVRAADGEHPPRARYGGALRTGRAGPQRPVVPAADPALPQQGPHRRRGADADRRFAAEAGGEGAQTGRGRGPGSRAPSRPLSGHALARVAESAGGGPQLGPRAGTRRGRRRRPPAGPGGHRPPGPANGPPARRPVGRFCGSRRTRSRSTGNWST